MEKLNWKNRNKRIKKLDWAEKRFSIFCFLNEVNQDFLCFSNFQSRSAFDVFGRLLSLRLLYASTDDCALLEMSYGRTGEWASRLGLI